jgi:hypothetical protein
MFDLATKYISYLNNDPNESTRIFLLLYETEKYVNGAIIQMTRLERKRSTIKKIFNKSISFKRNKFLLTYLACDTHYFFICIDKIYKLLNVLHMELKDNDIKKISTNISKHFKISSVRNHLEHIDDRCVGYLNLNDKKKNIKKKISDFGNFSGTNFTFDNNIYPVDKKSLNEIKKNYKELIKIIHNKYAMKNPEFIKFLEMEKWNLKCEKSRRNLKHTLTN